MKACVSAPKEANNKANCRFAALSEIAIKSIRPLCAPKRGTVACNNATQKANSKVK